MSTLEQRNSLLGLEFDRYLREHPELIDKIPNNAHVILLLEGDEEFNAWSTRIGKQQTSPGQQIVYVTVKKLGPAHSRIQDLSLATT